VKCGGRCGVKRCLPPPRNTGLFSVRLRPRQLRGAGRPSPPTPLCHKPEGGVRPRQTTSQNEARRKDGTKARLRGLRCCERRRERGEIQKEREKERDAFCLEQPWYLENQPLLSSAATSLFRAGSERAGGLPDLRWG